MSATLASSLSLLLFLLAWAMVLIAYKAPSIRGPLGAAGGLTLLVLSLNSTGGLASVNEEIFPASALSGGSEEVGTACAQALELLEENRVVLDRSDPTQVVVEQSLWSQIPGPTRELLADCLEAAVEADDRPIRIIER